VAFVIIILASYDDLLLEVRAWSSGSALSLILFVLPHSLVKIFHAARLMVDLKILCFAAEKSLIISQEEGLFPNFESSPISNYDMIFRATNSKITNNTHLICHLATYLWTFYQRFQQNYDEYAPTTINKSNIFPSSMPCRHVQSIHDGDFMTA
jgi:hypothetical protein